MQPETLFVFVTAKGRVMARLSNGTCVDATDHCDHLPRYACKEKMTRATATLLNVQHKTTASHTNVSCLA